MDAGKKKDTFFEVSFKLKRKCKPGSPLALLLESLISEGRKIGSSDGIILAPKKFSEQHCFEPNEQVSCDVGQPFWGK